jgi:two-component system, NtrC family, nitrogen regulation sensor histidine kinase NtrY
MKITRTFIVFLALIGMTIGCDFFLDNIHYRDADHRRLQKEIDKKIKLADRMQLELQDNKWGLNTKIPLDKGIIVLAYRKNNLIYWSDNSITLYRFNEDVLDGKRFDFISNGYYIIKSYIADSVRSYALILVKTQYPYENDFLTSRFQPDLKLPRTTQLLTEAQPGSFAVHDWEGIYLFSIRFSQDELKYSQLEKILTPSLYFLTLLALLLLLRGILRLIINQRMKNAAIMGLVLFFALFRFIQYRFHVPEDIYSLEVFGPVPFAKSAWLPSLGDIFVNTILLLFVIVQFNRDFSFPRWFYTLKGGDNPIIIMLMTIIITGFYIYTHLIFSNLILHSTINFETYKVASLTIYSLIGLSIAAMHFASLLLLAHKMLSVCSENCKFDRLIITFLITNTLIFFILYLFHYKFDFGSYFAFLILFSYLAIMHYRQIPLGGYAPLAFMVMFFSVYAVYFITYYSRQRTMENMRVMSENLAIQHDPVAEYLLEDISSRLHRDETLANYLFNWKVPQEQIFNHLQSNYFNGFWGKYKLGFIDCHKNTSIIIEEGPFQRQENCYKFYQNMLEGGSLKLPRTDFYFRDIQNGKINYLGWITYKKPGKSYEITLYIELESRLIAEELGYPELLLDKKYQKNKLLEEYSYAKYFKNQLLTQYGAFQYSLNLDTYDPKKSRFDGYNHLIRYINKDSAVMVSLPTTSFFDQLVSFSYLFLFFYLILLLYTATNNFSRLGRNIEFNFKNKIQLSIIAVLFLSLLLVGGGTIYFSIQQYQKKQHDLLSEKIQSVYIELDHMLAYQNKLNPDSKGLDYDDLNQLLIRFSDVFYSDINLYDPRGNLLATSRGEIFDQGIQGEKINPAAYDKMVKEKQAEFIHREKIGNLSYLSAYVPFVNADNKLLAYLNLPYFTKQNILRNDVTTLVVAILNIYVLLILLTIGMAVLISDQITRPLRLIQQKFSEIKLGKKNEQIFYHGRDEIAGLVDEYNRMVKELAKSVEMLARSERESAWREMAKQIAHEIKNPLTPMKLSVQHLWRSWKDNREDFDEFLEKVTNTLIEQIDNLSFIASEFSNFAKMPKAYNEEINLVDSIKSTLLLFGNTDNVDFVFDHESEEITVFADKEQLSRVFINLIKNAIQSIPENRKGRVGISAVLSGDMVRISLADNGKGIPEDFQAKLFTPSFTTKSSGMGLGLSIVKNIIESFNGHITFKTKVNHGTTFLIEIPVLRNREVKDENQLK